MNEQGDRGFRRGSVAGGTIQLRWQAVGQGDLVVDLVARGGPTRFHGLLAEHFHVAAVDLHESGAQASDAVVAGLGEIAAETGHQRCSLLVRGADLKLALRVTRERPGLIEALVLLAPRPADEALLSDMPSDIALPTLVLSGTRGEASPPEAGSRFRARLPNGHYVLVYDAGDAIEIDRPEAAASVVGDFLTRRERFIVAQVSGLIHP